MDKEQFYKLAKNPSLLNHDTLEGLKKLTDDFPHFHAAWLLYLKNLSDLNDPEFDAALKKAAPLLPDRKQLYWFIHDKPKTAAFASGIEPMKIQGNEYMLEIPQNQPPGSSLIDKFLLGSPGVLKINKTAATETTSVPDVDIITRSVTESDDLITETLANIYVEQKKYDKALKAFEKLSLKYPEKNSYFATRIKEIENLKNI